MVERLHVSRYQREKWIPEDVGRRAFDALYGLHSLLLERETRKKNNRHNKNKVLTKKRTQARINP